MGAFCNLLDWYRFEKYRPDFASNMRLHSLEYRLTYYNFAKGFFDRFIDTRQFIDINKLINKTVHNMLLKDHSITSRIVEKCREIDFKEAFTTIGNRFIDPEERGLMYKLTHDVIPTNAFWFKCTMQNCSHCTFCGRKYEETIPHLFMNCPQAVNVWVIVQNIFRIMANYRLNITEELMCFNLVHKVFNKALRKIKKIWFLKFLTWPNTAYGAPGARLSMSTEASVIAVC